MKSSNHDIFVQNEHEIKIASFEFEISKKIILCKNGQVWCDLIGLKIINTCEVAVISS